MKVRRHILARFNDHIKGRALTDVKHDKEGHVRYYFHGKVVLVVNSAEHAQLKKQFPGQFKEEKPEKEHNNG